jgi:hypothetical protein
MVAIAIGVGRAERLDYLDAAVRGAHAFHEWSSAMGYESCLVTDERTGVTVETLRNEFMGVLSRGHQPIHRLLVYFAGHGTIREAEQGLWFLSDWYRTARAVGVEALKRRLFGYAIDQIGVFADSCRVLPGTMVLDNVDAVGVLGFGPRDDAADQQTPVDRYFATADGAATFVVPGRLPSDDLCLFSGVLMPALWGTEPQAFSALNGGKVTSQSLSRFLRNEVPVRARPYGLDVHPRTFPGFPELDDIYFADDARVTVPRLPAWPEPAAKVDMRVPPEDDMRPADELAALFPEDAFHIADTLGLQRGLDGIDFLAESSTRAAERAFFANARVLFARTSSGFGIEYSGAFPYPYVRVAPRTTASHFAPASLLLELGHNRVAVLTALPRLAAAFHVADEGVDAIVYSYPGSARWSTQTAIAVLAALNDGGLSATAATDLAVRLRHGKHADPVLGVVAAYLYDAIDDVDSIRRIAFYYANGGEAIPYDVAMLGHLRGRRGDDSLLHARVPAVAQRAPRTQTEERTSWASEATGEVEGIVGGFCPWLRQGWALLGKPADDGSTLVLPPLADVASTLTPARFTTVDTDGARVLADYFQLAER